MKKVTIEALIANNIINNQVINETNEIMTIDELPTKVRAIIDGKEVDVNFALASRNIVGVDVLPSIGANVYDILRREKLVLTKDAVSCLEERLTW